MSINILIFLYSMEKQKIDRRQTVMKKAYGHYIEGESNQHLM